jgi:hypothetical protein
MIVVLSRFAGQDVKFDISPHFPYHAAINRAFALFLLTCDHLCGLSAGKLVARKVGLYAVGIILRQP